MLDRMRESLFNILQGRIEGRVFADLYAGTGAVGIEALSRGARQAIFVEANAKAARVIEENLRMLGADSDARVRMADVGAALPTIEADVYFLGPPYAAREEYRKTLAALGERPCELVIAQHDAKLELPERVGRLERYRVHKMGANALSFFREAAPDDAGDENSR
jgi:16S rRNA (guanine(966)-N(2))-methyltransferase RsmD